MITLPLVVSNVGPLNATSTSCVAVVLSTIGRTGIMVTMPPSLASVPSDLTVTVEATDAEAIVSSNGTTPSSCSS